MDYAQASSSYVSRQLQTKLNVLFNRSASRVNAVSCECCAVRSKQKYFCISKLCPAWHTTFVFAMWPAGEAAGCPAKPNVGFIKILKFNGSPGHSANMLLWAAALTLLFLTFQKRPPNSCRTRPRCQHHKCPELF